MFKNEGPSHSNIISIATTWQMRRKLNVIKVGIKSDTRFAFDFQSHIILVLSMSCRAPQQSSSSVSSSKLEMLSLLEWQEMKPSLHVLLLWSLLIRNLWHERLHLMESCLATDH